MVTDDRNAEPDRALLAEAGRLRREAGELFARHARMAPGEDGRDQVLGQAMELNGRANALEVRAAAAARPEKGKQKKQGSEAREAEQEGYTARRRWFEPGSVAEGDLQTQIAETQGEYGLLFEAAKYAGRSLKERDGAWYQAVRNAVTGGQKAEPKKPDGPAAEKQLTRDDRRAVDPRRHNPPEPYSGSLLAWAKQKEPELSNARIRQSQPKPRHTQEQHKPKGRKAEPTRDDRRAADPRRHNPSEPYSGSLLAWAKQKEPELSNARIRQSQPKPRHTQEQHKPKGRTR